MGRNSAWLAMAMIGCVGGNGGNGGEGDGDAQLTPMKEGTWHITIDRLTSNTCEAAGVTEDDIGIGEAQTVTLALDANGKGFTTDAGGDGDVAEWDLDGDEFSREYDTETEVEDPCFLRQDIAVEGRFTSRSFATSTLSDDVSTEGNCSAVNTDGLPCSYEVDVAWDYVGD